MRRSREGPEIGPEIGAGAGDGMRDERSCVGRRVATEIETSPARRGRVWWRAMRARFLFFILTVTLLVVACNSARQTRPMAYPGDGQGTTSSIADAVRKRGFEPVVKDREWVKFKYNERVWIHFKARPKEVVIAVDVADGKKLPKAEVDALFDEGMRAGEDIWKEASAAAVAAEARAAEEARLAKEREKQEEAARAANEQAGKSSGTTAMDVLGTIGSIAGSISVNNGTGSAQGGAPGQSSGSSQSYCCINKQYFDCPTPNAVRKACGELSACMAGCMNQSSMGCPDKCLKDHPPDTSECTRDTGRDGQCR